MAVNVLDRIEQLFNEAATNSTAEAIGASREAVNAAIRPALATAIRAVVQRSETADGAEYLLRTVSEFGGAVHGNFSQILESGCYEDVEAVGKRVASSLFGDEEPEAVEHVAGLAGLNRKQAASILHSVTGLVFDLAGEQRTKRSQNRLGVTKFFEAQRTLLRAEIATHILETVGLVEADFDTDSCELGKFAPSEDVGFVPPLQTTEAIADDATDTNPADTTTASSEETAESLGLGEVDLEEDEPDRLRDEVADALSNSPRAAVVIDPEELESLNQAEQARQEFVEEAEVVLSDGETKAFYAKSILALATLASLWFAALIFRSNQEEPSAQTKSTQATPTAFQTPDTHTDDHEAITEIRHTASNTTSNNMDGWETEETFEIAEPKTTEPEPTDLFAIDATPAKIATAMALTPDAATEASLTQVLFESWSKRENDNANDDVFAFEGTTPTLASLNTQSQPFDMPGMTFSQSLKPVKPSSDSPGVDLRRYSARPAEVRIEPISVSQQTPGLIAFKVVDSLRIPIFQQARATGKSYYTP